MDLLEEMDVLLKLDYKDLDKTEVAAHNKRLGEISARLEAIGASLAEAKATKILVGIGF